MHTVHDVLKTKGDTTLTVAPQETAYQALKLMATHNVGALLVVDHGKLTGIFSERDYARKVILHGKSSKDTPVSEIMTKDVLYIDPSCAINDCMALMTEKRVRHIPVMEEGELVGIVTIGDIVKQVISEQEFTIQQLEKYIGGTY